MYNGCIHKLINIQDTLKKNNNKFFSAKFNAVVDYAQKEKFRRFIQIKHYPTTHYLGN